MPLADMKGTIPLGGGADAVFNGLATGQVSLATDSIGAIVASNLKRARLKLSNPSTNTAVYVSSATDVTSGDGYAIPPGRTESWEYTGPLYGVSAVGTVVVSWAELG